MARRQVKNFESAVRLILEKDPLGCELIDLYYGDTPLVDAYIIYLKCFYCQNKPRKDLCIKAIRYLRDHGKITNTEYVFLYDRLKK